MNVLRILLATLGFACLLAGILAAVDHGSEAFLGLGLIIAGAIMITGTLISSTIVESAKRS
jgi:hypothetical protein